MLFCGHGERIQLRGADRAGGRVDDDLRAGRARHGHERGDQRRERKLEAYESRTPPTECHCVLYGGQGSKPGLTTLGLCEMHSSVAGTSSACGPVYFSTYSPIASSEYMT